MIKDKAKAWILKLEGRINAKPIEELSKMIFLMDRDNCVSLITI